MIMENNEYRSNMRSVMEDDFSSFRDNFSDNQFWGKLKGFAARAGIKVVYAALLLYYVLKSPGTPVKDRAKIIGALGYFILPLDLLPDAIPVIGFTDDLAALVWGLYSVARNITPEVKAKATATLHEWFGDFDEAILKGLI